MTQRNFAVDQGLQINNTVGNTTMTNTGITQMPDEDFSILVQDADDDGYRVELNVDDGAGNVLSSYQQQRDQIELGFPSTSTYYQFNDNGRLVLPANTEMWTDAGSNLNIIARSVTDSSFVEIMTQDNTDTKRSNITLTRDTANITTGSGTNTWTFDTNGTLTAPGNITAGNFVGAGSNVDIVAGSYNWTFVNDGNLVLPGNTFAVKYANGTAVSLGGNYGNANVADFLDSLGSNAIVTTGNITGGNIITANAASVILGNAVSSIKQNGSNATVNLSGSVTLSPDTAASANNGVVIGGNGYLLAPNGSRNAVLNYNGASGTMGIYAVNVYGNIATAIENGGANGVGNIGANASNRFNTVFATAGDFSGNVTAANFTGNISLTGNVTGTSPNVTLVAGSYSTVFDNTGVATFPGAMQLAVYANTTVRDSQITSPQPGMVIYVTGTGMQVRGATSWNTIAGSGT